MKLSIVVSRFPFPLEKGDKLRIYHQIKELSKRHKIQLHCLSDKTIKDEWKAEIQQYCEELYVYELKKPLLYFNTLKQLLGSNPFQIGYFYQSRIRKQIRKRIQLFQPDHIYAQLIRTAEYIKDIHDIPKTLDYMDALSKGMFRRAELVSGIKKKLYNIEGKRLAEYENRIFDYFNHHCIISRQDRDFIQHPDHQKITIVENGISEEFFGTSTVQQNTELLFTGNMNYPPNVECAEFLVHKILPIIDNDIRLTLAGASPNKRILAFNDHPRVEVTGWMDDIKMAYASAGIFVAPLFIGTGLQNKLLEAMAMGVPVITTPLANNALGAKDGKEILIANHAEDFANQIVYLLNNPPIYQEISAAAKVFVKKHYNWQLSAETLEKLFSS